jgi:hypothetical protein
MSFRKAAPARPSFFLLQLLLALAFGPAPVRAAAANGYDRPQPHPAIPLLDEAGRHVLQSGQPYSPKMTCGNGSGQGCHDYRKITRAYHFQQGRDEAADDFGLKRGLPQLVSPGYFGGYTCMGASNPAWLARKANSSAAGFGDLGAADALKECGGCHAGGGWAETDRHGARYDQKAPGSAPAFDGDYFSRKADGSVSSWDWQASGVREADCLHCHADFGNLAKFPDSGLGAADGSDGSDGAVAQYRRLKDEKLLAAGHFRHAASALLEFLNLRPETPGGLSLLSFGRSVVPGTSRPDYSLAADGAGKPALRWNRAAFDGNGKAHIPMVRFPGSDACMTCHETGNARRGFYGFGEAAREERDAYGIVQSDFRDDVHKGRVFTEDDGEARAIDNCNACHAKEYWKPAWRSVNLDADHQFPKGNGDNDVRNDLDGLPPVKSCEHCHDEAQNRALPSRQANVRDAHRVVWTTNGDMAGYPPETIGRITDAHLDVLACQTCHIKNLAGPDGTPLPIHYRYRRGHGGKLKIFPYNPAYRYYAADRTSGRVLYRWERDSVVERRDGYGAIVDPASRAELGRVPLSPQGLGDPDSAAGWKALKSAYERLLAAKGYANPKVRFVQTESNSYAISHNVRPSPESVQCAECHGRKQNGAFSSILADGGLLGDGQVFEVAKLPEKRLVDEGVFELGQPYYRVDGSGRITESVPDVLYASRLESSMTILKAESSRAAAGEFKLFPAAEAAGYAGLSAEAGARLSGRLGGDWLLFNSTLGQESIRRFALMLSANPITRLLLDDGRAEAESREVGPGDRRPLKKLLWGRPASDIYSLALADAARRPVKDFLGNELVVKLPYRGEAVSARLLRVAWSDDGKRWRRLPRRDLVEFHPGSGGEPGYVLARTTRPGARWVVMEKGRGP